MKLKDINIRDPFILNENSKYYLYGTRAKDFGKKTGGFDVYVSQDLKEWSQPIECFNSVQAGLDREVNWAPEVHKYEGSYYMFATFTRENGRRGVYILKSDNPQGPFSLHSDGSVTPKQWECLDGTLYVSKDSTPYLVFCHEHTQVIDGTVCYVELTKDLKAAKGEPVFIFNASSPEWADVKPKGEHYVTDGPFMYRTVGGELLMIWSTFINHKYSQCVAKSDNGEINGKFNHLPPLISDDGGHGMIFTAGNKLLLTFHTPNKTGEEHPTLIDIEDIAETIVIK